MNRVIRYRVAFDLTARADGVRCCTEVRFGGQEPGTATVVDLDVSTAAQVTLNRRHLPRDATQAREIELPDLEAVNVLTVVSELDYSGGGHGLCSVTLEGDRYVYLSLGPSTGAPVIPCFLRAGPSDVDVRVVAPAGWSVISHTPAVARPAPDSAGEWRFLVSLPMDARALTFVAGPMAVAPGSASPVRPRPSVSTLYGPRSAVDLVRASSVPDDLVRVLEYFERILGVAYPYDQADCVALPDYGSQGTFNHGVWLLHERVLQASVDDAWRRYVLWVLAHEAAHVWFGGLVFEGEPQDLWLLEGIATYLCHRALAELVPERAPWAAFHLLEEGEAHDADEAASFPVASWTSDAAPRSIPPSLIYAKPAAVMRHLESVIGVDAVDAGLQSFLTSLGDLDPEVRAACWVAGREMVNDDLMPPAELRHWVARHRQAETDPQILRQLDVLA
jgi:aminopeptidase N